MQHTRVVIAGASGLIGAALTASLRRSGATVTRLVRHAPKTPDEIEWDPRFSLDPGVLADADTVVGLNGASISKLPWTRGYRHELTESRITPTRTLASAIRTLGEGAPHFISASAVGFYGSQPGVSLTEDSAPGTTFLARLCADWESEALAAGPHARVALLRTAPLLDRRAVLKPLIALTRVGAAGPLGSGRQIWPWISTSDEIRAIEHVIAQELSGPVNLTGPTLASASEIGRELAQQMHRPFWVPAPAWGLRTALGRDAADSLLLADAEVTPTVLTRSGFRFTHGTPAAAIGAALASQEE